MEVVKWLVLFWDGLLPFENIITTDVARFSMLDVQKVDKLASILAEL